METDILSIKTDDFRNCQLENMVTCFVKMLKRKGVTVSMCLDKKMSLSNLFLGKFSPECKIKMQYTNKENMDWELS